MTLTNRVICIGLGGTGQMVLLYLKALLGEREGARRFRLLALDTDMTPLTVPDPRTGRPVGFVPDQEFLGLGDVPVNRLRQRLAQHPEIAQRLPMIRDLPATSLRQGARQQRPLGALAFLWHFGRIRSALHNLLWNLTDRRMATESPPEIQILVVTSLCGGTGSGMFLDVAYLLRHELSNIGDLAQRATLILVAVGPNAFHDVSGPNLLPNAIASLLELHHWMLRGNFQMEYRDGTRVEVDLPPYDLVFYVDAINEAGFTWPNREALARTLAEALLVLTATPLGAHRKGVLANLDSVLSNRTPNGELTCLSSLGAASLEWPMASLRALMAAESVRGFIEKLLQPCDRSDLPQGYIRQRPWSVEAFLSPKGLLHDGNGSPLIVRLGVPAWLEHLPDPEELCREARRLLERYRQFRLEGEFQDAVAAAARAWERQALEDLKAEIFSIFERHGLLAARRFLEGLREHISSLGNEAERARQRWQAREEEGRRRLEEAARGLSPWRPMAWPLIGRLLRLRLKRVLHETFAVAEEFYQARLQRMALEKAQGALARLQDGVERWQAELQRLEGRLGEAQSSLKDQIDRIRRELCDPALPPALRVVDESLLQELVARAREENPMVDLATLREWSEEGAQVLAQRWVEQAEPAFAFLAEWTLEQVFERQPSPTPQERLEALRRIARPAWQLDETAWPGSGSLVRLEFVGVADAVRTRFAGAGAQLVSTGDPHRLIVLTLTLGAPLSGLQVFSHYLHAYQKNPSRPLLHVFPDFGVAEALPRAREGLSVGRPDPMKEIASEEVGYEEG